MTNTTFRVLETIRFGNKSIGNHRTMKLRFKTETVELILANLPKKFHKNLLLYTTTKGLTFIACIDHQNSAIWPAIRQAINIAKNKETKPSYCEQLELEF